MRARVLLPALFAGACSVLPADEVIHGEPWPELLAEDGFTVGVRTGIASMGGDFDGDTALVGPDVIVVPDVGGGRGHELSLGYRRGASALQLSYQELALEGEGGSGDADVRGLSVDLLTYFRLQETLQPYLMFGIGGYRADLEDASVSGSFVGDADLTGGFGLRLGAGTAYHLEPGLAVDLLLVWTAIGFDRAEGVRKKEKDIDDTVEGSAWQLGVGLRYTF